MSDNPKLGLTTAHQAVVAVLSGAIICGLILLAFDAAGTFPPVVPWSVPIVLIALAIVAAVYSRILPKRVEERQATAQESFAALGVGKAMIMMGAVLAGAHVVYVVRYMQVFDAPLPSQRVVQGSVTIVAALLAAGAGALLERACLVKGDDEDQDGGEAGLSSAAS